MGVHDTYLEVRVVMSQNAELGIGMRAGGSLQTRQSMRVLTIYARRPRTERADKGQRGRRSPVDWTLSLSLHTGQA